MFFYETARGGNNPGRQKAPSGGPSVRDSKMKKALSKILMFSVISGFALAFAAGCVSQTYKNGVPVADEDEDAVKSREAFKEIMEKVLTVLAPDGVIVMNSVIAPKVTTDSHQLWDEACAALGLRQDPPTRIQLNDNHPITILRCRR